jgi:sugar phosphate isomerase/epimerase
MRMRRREFLAGAALTAVTGYAKPLGIPIGIQPYTVRNELGKDPEGTLRQLAQMGYEAIEAGAPFQGKPAAEARSLLRSVGLAPLSGGFGTPADDAGWARSIEDAKTLGAKYMIVTAPREWTTSLDGWKKVGERFNKLGAAAKKAGLAIAYHNHHFEYKVYDGVMAYDQLLRSTDPNLVKMEIDIFWTTIAGQDPLDYFAKYPGRFPLWHLKDLKKGYPPTTDKYQGNPFAEIGAGIIDWKRIFSGAKKAGLRYYFVEQDQWDRPPLESARMSCDFLKKFKP